MKGILTVTIRVRLLGLTAFLLLALLLGCNRALVPDARLREMFYANREDFNKLISMSQQDERLVRISSDLTLMQTDSGVKRNVGLSEERRQEYQLLFNKLGLSGGLERPQDFPSAILFYAHCEGSAIDADCKGFAYSERPLSPIEQSLDRMRPGTVFEQIGPHWYLFRWVS
jgi:hypothetical protein